MKLSTLLWISAATLAIAGLSVCAWPEIVGLVAGRHDAAARVVRVAAGRNILARASSDAEMRAALQRMTWADIAPTLEAASADVVTLNALLASTSVTASAPVRYLGAMLLLAQERPQDALSAFKAVPLGQIPSEHLYAPYRLGAYLLPAAPNPYLPPLRAAIKRHELSALNSARVLAQEGELRPALEAFLRTDPAQWTEHDVSLFRTLRLDAGLGNDTAVMLLAALRAARVPPALREALATLAKVPPSGDDVAKLTGGLEQTLQQNPQLRDVIAKAAQRQWDIRERFLRHQYSSLLLQHAHADPLTLGSETVYLLFLSAAKAANTEAYDRWAQELKRRFPSKEVSAWICESRPHA